MRGATPGSGSMSAESLDAGAVGHVLSLIPSHRTLSLCAQTCSAWRDEARHVIERRYATQHEIVDAVAGKLLAIIGEPWRFQRVRSFEWTRHVHRHSPRLQSYADLMVTIGKTRHIASPCGLHFCDVPSPTCRFCQQQADLHRRVSVLRVILLA